MSESGFKIKVVDWKLTFFHVFLNLNIHNGYSKERVSLRRLF